MAIDRIQSEFVLRIPALQEIRPAASQQPKSASRIADGDTVSFEAVYISTLPRVPVTEAHRRLETLRERLVAGHTHVPIHFNDPRVIRSGGSYADPHTSALKFSPNPAEINVAATSRALGDRH